MARGVFAGVVQRIWQVQSLVRIPLSHGSLFESVPVPGKIFIRFFPFPFNFICSRLKLFRPVPTFPLSLSLVHIEAGAGNASLAGFTNFPFAACDA